MNIAKSSSSYLPEDADRLLALADNVTQPDAALELHRELKNLKTGTITFQNPIADEGSATFQVTWDEGQQAFDLRPNNAMAAMTAGGTATAEERLTGALVDIARKLTQCAQIDREARRATNYPIDVQDEHGFLSKLLSSENNPANASITIVHQNREEALESSSYLKSDESSGASGGQEKFGEIESSPSASAFVQGDESTTVKTSESPQKISSEPSLLHTSDLKKSAAIATTHSTSLSDDKPVLVYGFDKTYRKTMMEALKEFRHPKMQTMNNYMRGLCIDGSFGFQDYCDFHEQATAGTLEERVSNIVSDSPCSEIELKEWARCLTRNISKFNFSRKCDSPEKRILFFVKNCDAAKILGAVKCNKIKTASDIIGLIKNQNWDDLMPALEPAFDLLENRENLSTVELKERYAALTPEARVIFNVVLCKAFFRKTSKLGLTFAKEQEKTVLFAWNASGTNEDLQGLHDLLEVKQYRLNPPKVRVDVRKKGLEKLAPESTTFSEMRELGRLKQRMMAPNYVLITKITSGTSSKEAEGSKIFEKDALGKISGSEKAASEK